MEQVIVQLPQSGGQIYTLSYPDIPAVEQPQESVVQDSDLNLRQRQCLEVLFIFKHATADLLLRYLRLNTLRYLQTHLAAMYSEVEKDRHIEYLIPNPGERFATFAFRELGRRFTYS